LVGFLGCHQVTARSFSFSFCRALVSSDVTEALCDSEFLDFGGTFVRSTGFIVAIQVPTARLLVTLMSKLSLLGGTLHVFLRDGLPGGKLLFLPLSSSARWAAALPGESAMTRH
jgi:hypothetical protein